MAKRPTITDLAREAGVSVATVDRVLNGRAKVREET
ncbi:MAG: LacI family DNA-binding transcriptional regulator, partial [Mameliella sp.]|nr:LacI family DNA-binding transcriptional regulator [Mameliella sp.]